MAAGLHALLMAGVWPVVLTAATAILAMIPLTRSVFWGPLAVAIMGGLSVATFLTRPVIERLAPMLGAKVEFGEAWLQQRIDSIVDMALNGIRTRREA